MSKQTLLPCFKCGKELDTVFDAVNQPSGGTEFRTYGHYGSTFWDAFHGEELVLNICDDCLGAHTSALARHKRYVHLRVSQPSIASTPLVVGRQWVDREMVPYFDGPEDEEGDVMIEPEEVGHLHGHRIEWANNIEDLRKWVEES